MNCESHYGKNCPNCKPKEISSGLNKAYRMVRTVHEKFNSPIANEPTPLSGFGAMINRYYALEVDFLSEAMKEVSKQGGGGQVLKRVSWIVEEVGELLKAETLEDQADALTDIFYFVMGSFVEIGVNPEKLFNIVNESNMGKLWEDGKPRFDEQGKWIKPPWWEDRFKPEPKLAAEIERQRTAAAERFRDLTNDL